MLKSNKWTYKLLNLEKGEGRLVVLPVIYSFFTGASLAYFVTSSTSLFLNIFDRDMLSVAFIAAGVIVWIVGQAFSLVQKKFDFSKSLTIGLGFLLLSIIIFIGFFIGSRPLVIIFIIYAWIRVFAYMHAVTFWGLAGRLFSLRQGKRLFGLISGGEVIASIISFFSVPFLLEFISTEDLLFISGINLFIGFLILLAIVKKNSTSLSQSDTKKQGPTKLAATKKTSFLQNKYYKLFFIIAFIPIFAQFFVDYIFQAQAKMEYPGKEELTAFVGIFFGFSSIIEFILKSFISGRLLSRYGMKLGLLAFPIVMIISMTLATLFGFVYGAFSLFFSFIALGRLFTRAVRTSFNDPATQLLYQPLPPDERISFQNKVESGPKAYASIIAGIFLLIFAKIPGVNLVYFSLFLLIVSVIWTISAKKIYQEYRNVLQSILSRKKTADRYSGLHPIVQAMISGFEEGNQAKTISIASLSRIIIPFETDEALNKFTELKESLYPDKAMKFSTVIELSHSINPADRIEALRQIHKYSIYKVEKPLVRMLHDEDFQVKCEAIIASARMRETELFHHLVTLFQNPEYRITASNAILKTGAAMIPELNQNFQKTEFDIQAQLDTVELIEKIAGEKAIEFLRTNMAHHNKSVSDRIIQALGKLKYRAGAKESNFIWQKLENEIKNYVFVTSSYLNLKELCNDAMLFQALENEMKDKKSKVFWNLTILYDPFAIKLIEESLDSPDKNDRGFAIEVADMVISDLHKPLIFPFIESNDHAELIQKYMSYFPSEKLSLAGQLTDIINSEHWVTGLYTKASALKLLSSLKDKGIMQIMMANIVHPRQMMWQLAAYCIYHLDKKVFENEIYQNFPKVHGLKDFASEIDLYLEGKKTLIFDRVLFLKTLELFKDIPEDELIETATLLSKRKLGPNESISIHKNQRNYILIKEGGLKLENSGIHFGPGDIFCSFLQHENEILNFVSTENTSVIMYIDFHLINGLAAKHEDFSARLIENLRKNNSSGNSTEVNPTIGMINQTL